MSTLFAERSDSASITEPAAASAGGAPRRQVRFFARLPLAVFAVAALAGLLHVVPVWRMQQQTPPGWTYTGNIGISPDFMQYRVWERQSQLSGVLVSDSFTSEPNQPHLLVPFYFAIGQVAHWTGWQPEFVYDYAGSILAFGLTILLFATVRFFLNGPTKETWAVFLAALVGGGLGGYLKLLSGLPMVGSLFGAVVRAAPLWEDYRGHYIFVTLFDSHFLLVWLVAAAAVVSLYFALERPSFGRLALTAGLYALSTCIHLYEGVTLVVITAAVALLCWRRRVAVRPAIIALAVTTPGVVAGLLLQWLLYRSSGLPSPTWRAVPILFATLVIAYPLAWGIIGWGLRAYWRKAGLKECYLLGWALGCTALTLSAPFYPYPDRGTMTLQIPLSILAGAIYFSRRLPMTRLAVAIAVLVLGATPAYLMARQWVDTSFNPAYPFLFLSPEHSQMLDVLDTRASANDVLLEEQADALWLAPEYPGKHYSAHFFLTVDYDRKQAAIARFFESPPDLQGAFLEQQHIRFVFVNRSRQPDQLARVPGLRLLAANGTGSLFEYAPGGLDAAG